MLYYGEWVRSKLNERHEKTNKPLHTLKELLSEKSEKPGSTYDRLLNFFGMGKGW